MKFLLLVLFASSVAFAGSGSVDLGPTFGGGGGGGGTVTSVDMSVPAFLSVSGNPITTSGTLAVTYSGTAIPLANGGTSATTKAGAFNALSPMTTSGDIVFGGTSGAGTRLAKGSDGQVLTLAAGLPSWAAASTGTVTSVSATVPAFLSVSGSPVTTSGTLAFSYSGSALPIANGGTSGTTKAAAFDALSPMTTSGDIIYGGASGTGTRLAKGSDGNVLTLASGVPSWAAPSSGTQKWASINKGGMSFTCSSFGSDITWSNADAASGSDATMVATSNRLTAVNSGLTLITGYAQSQNVAITSMIVRLTWKNAAGVTQDSFDIASGTNDSSSHRADLTWVRTLNMTAGDYITLQCDMNAGNIARIAPQMAEMVPH